MSAKKKATTSSTTTGRENPKKRAAPTPIRFPAPMLERLEREAAERGVSRAHLILEALQLRWELEDGAGELWETVKAHATVHGTAPGKVLAELLAKLDEDSGT